MNKLSKDDKLLIAEALKVRKNAYAPYSKFKVGAALLGRSGKIYAGCNVENATYGATICAERSAVSKAVTDGERSFKKIAVVADMKEPCPPCGICRQILFEFSPNMKVIMVNLKGKTKIIELKKLLPSAFRL